MSALETEYYNFKASASQLGLECGVVFDNGLVDLKEKGMSREVVLEH